MISLIRVLILLELILLPLLPATSQFGYEHIKILFFIFSTSLMVFIWMVLLLQGRLKVYWTIIKLLSFLFVTILLVSSIIALDPLASITGRDPYYQGWVVYGYLFLLSLVISTVGVDLKQLSLVFVSSSLLVSVVALRQWIELSVFHLQIPNYAGRVVSTFGQPNFYAGFLLFSLPFLYKLYQDSKKWWFLVGILVTGLGILSSQSRIAIIMVVILAIFSILRPLKNKLIVLFGGTILFIILLVMAGWYEKVYQQEFIEPNSQQWLIDNAPEKRIFIWPIVVEGIGKSWLFGYGLENLNPVFDKYLKFHGDRTPAYYGIKNLVVDRSHNYMLDLLVFTGVIGLIIWLLLVFRVLFVAKSNPLLFSGLVIYLVWVQLQNQSVAHLIYFWLLVGLTDGKVVDKRE